MSSIVVPSAKKWTNISKEREVDLIAKDEESGLHIDCRYCIKYEPNNPKQWRILSSCPFGIGEFNKHCTFDKKHVDYKRRYLNDEKLRKELTPEEYELVRLKTKQNLKEQSLHAFLTKNPAQKRKQPSKPPLPRNICRGILSQKQSENKETQLGLKYYCSYYKHNNISDRSTLTNDGRPKLLYGLIGDSDTYSIFSSLCNGIAAPKRVQLSTAGKRCSKYKNYKTVVICSQCDAISQSKRNNEAAKMRRKVKFFKPLDQCLDGTIDIADTSVEVALNSVKCIGNEHLSMKGLELVCTIRNIQEYVEARKPEIVKDKKKRKQRSKTFLERWPTFIEKHGEHFEKTLLHDFMINYMNFMENDSTAPKGDRVMNFQIALASSGSGKKASEIVAANLYGPAYRTMQAKIANETAQDLPPLLIDMSKSDMIAFVCNLIEDNFDKAKEDITFSMSCDASKTVPLPQVCTSNPFELIYNNYVYFIY